MSWTDQGWSWEDFKGKGVHTDKDPGDRYLFTLLGSSSTSSFPRLPFPTHALLFSLFFSLDCFVLALGSDGLVRGIWDFVEQMGGWRTPRCAFRRGHRISFGQAEAGGWDDDDEIRWIERSSKGRFGEGMMRRVRPLATRYPFRVRRSRVEGRLREVEREKKRLCWGGG